MNFISWNVNGLRGIIKKNFYEFFNAANADFFSVQDTRVTPDELDLDIADDYYQFWDSADRPGYAGTAVFTKHKPLNVAYGMTGDNVDEQGRTITLEYSDFYLVNVYAPVAGAKLIHLNEKETFDNQFIKYVAKLNSKKPVIIGGDLNIAHEPIDVFNPEEHKDEPGYTDIERKQFSELLTNNFTDIFRKLHPSEKRYTYWSYRDHARLENHGWRLDYFVIANKLVKDTKVTNILDTVSGSDHCPVQLIINNIKA